MGRHNRAKHNRGRNTRKHPLWKMIMLQILLLAGALLVVSPFLWTITTSLKPIKSTFEAPYLVPVHFVWQNYVDAWQAAPFPRYYLNTCIVTLVIMVGQILTSAMSGYAFSRLSFPGRDALFLVFLGTMMVPFYVLVIPLFLMVDRIGWVDTYWGLTIPRIVSPFGIFLMRQSFLSIPKELDEAALIDGCSKMGILWRVIMPLAKPAVSTLSIFAFLFAWNDYLWPMIATRSPEMYTVQIGLRTFMGKYGTQWVLLMAGVATSTIPVLILFFAAQSQVVEGIATSGLKG